VGEALPVIEIEGVSAWEFEPAALAATPVSKPFTTPAPEEGAIFCVGGVLSAPQAVKTRQITSNARQILPQYFDIKPDLIGRSEIFFNIQLPFFGNNTRTAVLSSVLIFSDNN
jgi:hypothetical protein